VDCLALVESKFLQKIKMPKITLINLTADEIKFCWILNLWIDQTMIKNLVPHE
jgi:hypothetical protein